MLEVGSHARSDTRQVERVRRTREARRLPASEATAGPLIAVGAAMAVALFIAHRAEMRVVGALGVRIGFPMALRPSRGNHVIE